MSRILVLGAAGMAGHVISLYLRENGHEVDTLSGTNALDKQTYLINVLHSDQLETVLSSVDYDVVINCIGILIKQSDSRKDLACYLNAYLPHYLEHRFKNTDTKIIHLSTDCVFSGLNPPYKEDSPFDGESIYDRSKALGELNNGKDLTLRMSIIGPDLKEDSEGLFGWFYRQTGEISGYTRAIWDGVATTELARGILAAIEQDLTGLYHFVPHHNISKFDLLGLFKDVFNRDDITIVRSDAVSVDKTLVNTRTDFDFKVKDYKDMLEDMRSWIQGHRSLYPHYKNYGTK